MSDILSHLTILIPLAAALGTLFWFCRWVRLHRRAGLTPAPADETADGPGRGRPQGRLLEKRDWLVMGLLTAVYAVVAFVGLGDNTAPQSFLHFEGGNYYALVDLGQERELSGLRYYPGLCTADYTLEVSIDGENWITQTRDDGDSVMPQGYTDLFRWCDAKLRDDSGPYRYLRIISGGEEYLGEIALYGEDGRLLTTDEFSVAPGCEQLVDEQDTIPEEYAFTNGTYFDEIYHPRTALEMIEEIWPYEITHPPLGKAILSLGIRIFGMTPFGWRFMGTLFGVLMLPILYVFLKKLFGYLSVALCGTTIFAFDFMHYVQTRLATIDTYAVFFTLLMYLFMYLWLTETPGTRRRLLWLALCGVSFGLGAASKWTCFYAGAGLAVLWAAYWVVRLVRERDRAVTPLLANILWCMLFFLAIPAVIYYVSYYSYAPSQGIEGGLSRLFDRRYLQIVLDNQSYMWNYHSALTATHPYSSTWYQWLLDVRPILYYVKYFDDGTKSIFGAFMNPLVCWGGLLAMGGMVWLAIRERDMRAIFILVGYLANLLPWVLVSRIVFAYHYFPCLIFLVLAIARIFEDLRRRDPRWRRSVGGFTAACAALFVMFYPVLSGARVSESYTKNLLRWFEDTWPF